LVEIWQDRLLTKSTKHIMFAVNTQSWVKGGTMHFIGFSNKDFPSVPPLLRMDDGYGKFVLLLNDRLQSAYEGIILAGGIDRHALLVALHLGLTSGLRADLAAEEVDSVVLNPIYQNVGWGSSGWSIYDPPSDPNLVEMIKETLTNGLKNNPRLWTKAE
jgi:hypothetical protein